MTPPTPAAAVRAPALPSTMCARVCHAACSMLASHMPTASTFPGLCLRDTTYPLNSAYIMILPTKYSLPTHLPISYASRRMMTSLTQPPRPTTCWARALPYIPSSASSMHVVVHAQQETAGLGMPAHGSSANAPGPASSTWPQGQQASVITHQSSLLAACCYCPSPSAASPPPPPRLLAAIFLNTRCSVCAGILTPATSVSLPAQSHRRHGAPQE